jgi:hypothetical protein
VDLGLRLLHHQRQMLKLFAHGCLHLLRGTSPRKKWLGESLGELKWVDKAKQYFRKITSQPRLL